MAHRCWAVDDIVRVIIEILVRDQGRASAVALASCSKSLEEPALREVWRTLPGPVPLVKCFPPEVWEIRGKERILFFKRAPFEVEWTRFQKRYASKVQHLRVSYHYQYLCLSSTALRILQLYSFDGPLLPNLVSLEWASDDKYLPFISMFISPSLTSIVIDVLRKPSLMLLPVVFKKLSTLSPNIREIEIGIDGDDDRLYHDPSMEEASSQLLMHCSPHLRKFQVDSPISASAFKHVIQLPSLEEFRLVTSIQLPDPLPIPIFPSLRELDVECNGDLTWLKLLPAIENPVLRSIRIKCPGSDVGRFMETFQATMTGCGMHECLQEFVVKSADNFKITPQIIACNFSFKNLTFLLLESECFDLCCQTDLADGDIDLLTRAMPCLENLTIGEAPCGVPSQITFKSLYTISRRCTRLTELLIHFNPALFVTKLGREFESWNVALGLSDTNTPSSDLCQVRTIYIGNIPLPTQSNASCILALGLLGVFPRLEEIEYHEIEYHENDSWRDVEDLIGVFRRMGCSAFGPPPRG